MLQLFGHPFSSYTWKALIALYEADQPFEFRSVDPSQGAANHAELAQRWPLAKFPVLVDGDVTVIESSIIVEHLALRLPGAAQLVPAVPHAALPIRFLDRVFDNHVMTPMNAIVHEHIPFIAASPDPDRIARGRAALDAIYGWLDARLTGEWACGDAFTLADCAAAPALFYADWAHPIGDQHGALKRYRARLLARPSVARAVDGARPYRHLFPLGGEPRE